MKMGEPRAHWGRLIGASLVVLAAAFVVPWFVAPPDLAENRPLADAPAPPRSLGELAAYRKAADAYVADRFPARTLLIAALNRLRLAAGVSGSPRVVVGRDGWLFDDDGSHMAALSKPLTDVAAQAWLAGLAGRSESLAAQGKAYVVICPPMKPAVYPDRGPAWLHIDPNRPAAALSRLARASGAGHLIYLDAALAQPTRWGLKTYSPHDTHWTGLGAYLGYAAFMRELQAEGIGAGPRPLERFREVHRGEPNKPRNLALMLGVASFVDVDYPELADPADEVSLQVTYLSAKHDWTGPHVIDTGQAGKPVLLITVDSFSNAFLPFLYGDFSRIVVAHLDDGFWRPDLIARFNPDVVVTEVVESGLGSVMTPAPPASPEALAGIRTAVARWRTALQARPIDPKAPYRRLDGTDGPDQLRGGDGRDDIQGKPGDDAIEGLAGDDVLRGGRGRDMVDGGEGDDWVSGDRGDDTLKGGPGADVFHSFVGAGTDLVLDFFAAEGDRIELDPGAVYTVRQAGPDAVIELQGARLILKGVQAADLPGGAIRVKRPPLAPSS
jgi:Ca2+-binding RTX toxin-like protein